MSDVPVRGKRLVARVVLLQTGSAVLVASLFLCFRGQSAGLAALVGGMIVAIGSAVFGWRVFKPGTAGGASMSTALYVGVAMKWLWFGTALYVAFALLKLEPAPLLIGLVAAHFGYWVGLIRPKGLSG